MRVVKETDSDTVLTRYTVATVSQNIPVIDISLVSAIENPGLIAVYGSGINADGNLYFSNSTGWVKAQQSISPTTGIQVVNTAIAPVVPPRTLGAVYKSSVDNKLYTVLDLGGGQFGWILFTGQSIQSQCVIGASGDVSTHPDLTLTGPDENFGPSTGSISAVNLVLTSRNGTSSLQLQAGGDILLSGPQIGFYNHAAVPQAAHPVLLGDVITILTNLGLCA